MRAGARLAVMAGLAVAAWVWRDRLIDLVERATTATNVVTVRPERATSEGAKGQVRA